MTNGIRVHDMSADVSETEIRAVYHEILEPSFGPDELDTLATLLDGLASGEVWGLCALDGRTPVGCVLGYPYPKSQVLLIGYVTVRPGLRGSGIGGLLMDAVEQRWTSNPDLTLVVAEVEDPRHHPVVGDIDPKRRTEFYARRGASVVVGPYFQPKLEGVDKKRVRDLFLTVLGGSIESRDSVPAAQIEAFLLEYFRDSGEGGDFPRDDDEEGTRLLAWYRERETVPLQPMAEYADTDIPSLGT